MVCVEFRYFPKTRGNTLYAALQTYAQEFQGKFQFEIKRSWTPLGGRYVDAILTMEHHGQYQDLLAETKRLFDNNKPDYVSANSDRFVMAKILENQKDKYRLGSSLLGLGNGRKVTEVKPTKETKQDLDTIAQTQ